MTFLTLHNELEKLLNKKSWGADTKALNCFDSIQKNATELKTAHEEQYRWTPKRVLQDAAEYLFWIIKERQQKPRDERMFQYRREREQPKIIEEADLDSVDGEDNAQQPFQEENNKKKYKYIKALLHALRVQDFAAAENVFKLMKEDKQIGDDGKPNNDTFLKGIELPEDLADGADEDQKLNYPLQCYSGIIFYYLQQCNITNNYLGDLETRLRRTGHYNNEQQLLLDDHATLFDAVNSLNATINQHMPEYIPERFWWYTLADAKNVANQNQRGIPQELQDLSWEQLRGYFGNGPDNEPTITEEGQARLNQIFRLFKQNHNQNDQTQKKIYEALKGNYAGEDENNIPGQLLFNNSINLIASLNAERKQKRNSDPKDINRQLALVLTLQQQRKNLARISLLGSNDTNLLSGHFFEQRRLRKALGKIVHDYLKQPELNKALKARLDLTQFDKQIQRVKAKLQNYQEKHWWSKALSKDREEAAQQALKEINQLEQSLAKNFSLAPEQGSRGLHQLDKIMDRFIKKCEENDSVVPLYRNWVGSRAKRLANSVRKQIDIQLNKTPLYEYKRAKKIRQQYQENLQIWAERKKVGKNKDVKDKISQQHEAMLKLCQEPIATDPINEEARFYKQLMQMRDELPDKGWLPESIRRHTRWCGRRDIIGKACEQIEDNAKDNLFLEDPLWRVKANRRRDEVTLEQHAKHVDEQLSQLEL